MYYCEKINHVWVGFKEISNFNGLIPYIYYIQILLKEGG